MRRLTDMIRDWAGRRRADAAIASTAAEPTPVDDLRDFIRREVAGGFYDDDAVLRNAVEVHEGEIAPALLRSEAQRLLRVALAEHRLAQSGWPTHTDCDRLDAAFEALEATGIVSRQNFTCCGTCGIAEISAEIEDAEAAGQIVRGYTFYHAQDTRPRSKAVGCTSTTALSRTIRTQPGRSAGQLPPNSLPTVWKQAGTAICKNASP